MLRTAFEHKVAYIPGANFSPNGPGPSNTLRLNYSNSTPERIHEGIRRLAEVVNGTATVAVVVFVAGTISFFVSFSRRPAAPIERVGDDADR